MLFNCFVDLEFMFFFLEFWFEVRIWNISVKDAWKMDEVWWTERGGIVYFHWVGSSCKLVKTESKLWHGSILTPFLQPLVPFSSFTKADPSGAWRAWRHRRHEMCKIRMQWWQGGRRTLRRPVFKTKTLPQKRRVPGLPWFAHPAQIQRSWPFGMYSNPSGFEVLFQWSIVSKVRVKENIALAGCGCSHDFKFTLPNCLADRWVVAVAGGNVPFWTWCWGSPSPIKDVCWLVKHPRMVCPMSQEPRLILQQRNCIGGTEGWDGSW